MLNLKSVKPALSEATLLDREGELGLSKISSNKFRRKKALERKKKKLKS